MDDRQIITLYENRDEQAITETDRSYGPYCRTVANNILNDPRDTEEVVADTWLKTWNSIPPHKPRCLKQFLAKITRNLSLSRWRSIHSQKRGSGQVEIALEELSQCVSGSADLDSHLSGKLLEETINRFLLSLPERERNLFIRRYFYLETTDSIAERYGLKSPNVLQVLSRTRKKLKKRLIEEGYEP